METTCQKQFLNTSSQLLPDVGSRLLQVVGNRHLRPYYTNIPSESARMTG